ncbi:MAG TPA: M23 family metallopeptidase [Candidatus Limnocylindria bacterium]|nr:M23 family metallopeptidase [Candidatus Limnocylindria bacterium]
MTIHNTRLRVLYACVTAALCVLAFGARANADDGTTTPARAIPLARALPRTFPSYDALITTATAVANDQVSLYAQLQATTAEHDLATSILATVADPRVRGGFVRAETNVSDEPAMVALRAEIASTEARQARLVASGAIAIPPAATWQRPLVGGISQPFGPTSLWLEPARLYQGTFYWHFHDGVDITDPAGTPIVAPARGRVVFVGRMMDGAEVVVLAHDDGLVSLFAHLQDGPLAPTIKAGDIVQAGDRIGAVGLTGLTTGYHLHWAVYRNGVPIDPLATLGG